jgi:hypothetical protein
MYSASPPSLLSKPNPLLDMPDQEKDRIERIAEDRSTPFSYVLNEKDIRFCTTGEGQGTIKKSKLKSRIRSRLQKIPERFQNLVDDIAIARYSDVEFLFHSEWEEICQKTFNIERRWSNIPVKHKTKNSNFFDIGFVLAASVKRLSPTITQNRVDLIWGFILGLVTVPTTLNEKENIDNLLNAIKQKNNNREKYVNKQNKKRKIMEEIYNNTEDKIVDVLQNKDIDIKESPIPIDHVFILMSQMKAPEKEELENLLENIIDIDQMKELSYLITNVRKTIEEINNETWRNQDAISIFDELWMRNKTETQTTINNLNSLSDQNTGRKLINQYSSPNDYETTAEHPLIEKQNNEVRLTEYGRLVSYCLFENDSNCEWIYLYKTIGNIPAGYVQDISLSEERQSMVENAAIGINMNTILE